MTNPERASGGIKFSKEAKVGLGAGLATLILSGEFLLALFIGAAAAYGLKKFETRSKKK